MMKNLVGQPIELIDTPVPLIHLDALERNIAKMSKTIVNEARVGWRPHTKSMKNPISSSYVLMRVHTGSRARS